jgi:hypothetical protein
MRDATPRYARAPRLAWRRVLDELVVLDLERHMVYGLGDAAAGLFERLAQPCSLAELSGAADVAPSAVESRALLHDLAAAGLVVCEPPASSFASAAADEVASTAIRWREKLEQVTHQLSPPQTIGNPQCIQ